MSRDILVVKREKLFPNGVFQGFLPRGYFNFEELIKNNFEYSERNDALENDIKFVQIIPYIWLINSKTKKVFIYQRAPGSGQYTDKRYVNKYSGGIGGHIDKDTEQESIDPVMDAMMRELKEELVMQEYPLPEFFGYIKDNSDMFNKVHLGVIGKAETDSEDVKPADGMKQGQFYSAEEVDNLFSDQNNEVEPWTRISWPFIKEFLK
jgi:predicted NUDIX family phosphoesterase